MTTSIKLFPAALRIAIAAAVFFSCHKTDNPDDSGNKGNGGGGKSVSPDSLSNHLQFFSATRITGISPTAPANGSIKISFEDTLVLVGQVNLPVRFLQPDTTQDVT